MTVVVTHTTPADSTFSSTGAAAWNADHALSGVGTMAEQNANNVAITGGTIDNTVIGGTTPAAGTFTTLTATGQTSLGGVANSESLRVNSVASAVNWVEVTGGASGSSPTVKAAGAGRPLVLSGGSGSNGVNFYSNNLATQQFQVAHTASAVNYVQVTGAATTGAPTISAQGSDGNISLSFNQKGSGNLNFQTSGVTRHRVNGADGSVDSGLSSSGGVSLKALPLSNQVNYLQAAGNATGLGVQFSAQGSDTNISQVFQSKGTGAIDLAAGSSGVNISNGGTVTAITRTSPGGTYTSAPTPAISAPTTAGGVQATATCTIGVATSAVSSGGTGYTLNDVLTFSGGTFTAAATATVSAVSGGVITAITMTSGGTYTVAPTNPVSVTGGTGTSATFTLGWGINSTFTITNAGSGYVEQPTITFSGGGGSGATAYATVGSGTVVKSIGSTMDFYTPAGLSFRVEQSTSFGSSYWKAQGAAVTPSLITSGANGIVGTGGAGVIQFITNSSTEQFRVAHTASAVNYVQVTGAATGNPPIISSQGSDSTVAMLYVAKGGQDHRFFSNTGNAEQFRVLHTAGTMANHGYATGAAAGASPVFGVRGSDTNIDLTLTPKGTGNVRFGTYTGTALSIAGYIEIKDAGGTIRKLAVVA